MAINILDRYGIKEVCDFTFYQIDKDESGNAKPGAPVLYLDTLKVSTTEQTAENTSARGGKGNPELITWDYGKEINVTLEDALFSAKSMAIMFGSVNSTGEADIDTTNATIWRTVSKANVLNAEATTCNVEIRGTKYALSDVKYYKADGTVATASGAAPADYAYAVGKMNVKESATIDISPETFPGTYYCTGDTYARREDNGEDEFFQLVIPKAKITSENTLTMEAEGDPSTFSMNLKVLRPANGPMMKLIKYSLTASE